MANELRSLRCAIYTRKSTEHGLELEFNSLDAQRDACEAYIKSQASQGWKALPQHYDDPAYSGGNLDRPALKKLLADIEAHKIDVVVVYKIDRLTRSLADFAKLVEAFDARSISFVAVTQQFNTTTSMGRLTLNVLLSFAQFERELSSERVKDKIAASRRKGKWTGGTVPLGYDAKDKKFVVNKTEAETVRMIFCRYLELRSFSKLVADLDRRGIVTKRRSTKVAKFNGGIPFTYGPLAYFLKNRVYVGEVHHGGKWFDGEHKAIVDRATFGQVQQLLSTKVNGRKAKRSESGALLMGKLYDDKGNLMSPSFSSKNGVRYRFYVSSALLRGRKALSGSVTRVSAPAIEQVTLQALRAAHPDLEANDAALLERHLLRVQLGDNEIKLSLLEPEPLQPSSHSARRRTPTSSDREIRISWVRPSNSSTTPRRTGTNGSDEPDQKLVQAVVRAHRWANALVNAEFASLEELSASVKLHPKVVRNEIRLAFLAPQISESVLTAGCAFGLPDLRRIATLSWQKQMEELHYRQTSDRLT
jgi:DNA invertase Pin-like site-specific DNA recombinase